MTQQSSKLDKSDSLSHANLGDRRYISRKNLGNRQPFQLGSARLICTFQIRKEPDPQPHRSRHSLLFQPQISHARATYGWYGGGASYWLCFSLFCFCWASVSASSYILPFPVRICFFRANMMMSLFCSVSHFPNTWGRTLFCMRLRHNLLPEDWTSKSKNSSFSSIVFVPLLLRGVDWSKLLVRSSGRSPSSWRIS